MLASRNFINNKHHNIPMLAIKKIKKEFKLAIKITVIVGVFFYILNGNYTIQVLMISMAVSGLYSFSLGFGQGLLNEYLSTKWDWVTQTSKRAYIGLIATVIYTIPVVLSIDYILFVLIKGGDATNFFKFPMLWQHLFWIILSFGISSFLHARSFMLEWKNASKQETTKQQIVAKTESAKFESLKNQIDPHFLFNSLNVLTSLISENPKQAERFTTKLSKIYRYVLEQRNKELVPIAEELKFARTYMELLQMRFEDALEFHVTASVINSDLKLVPLSLQLLLENAVKHNVVSSLKPLQIKIYEEDGFLKVSNNSNPKEAIGKSTKVGLQNIADRYGLISNETIRVENTNKLFTVSLPLLTKTKNIMKTSEDFEKNNYVKAVAKVEKIKDFYKNLSSYIIVMPFLIFINLRFSSGFNWFWFPLFGWGMGVAFQALDVYGYSFVLGKDWEERKIKELMNKDKK